MQMVGPCLLVGRKDQRFKSERLRSVVFGLIHIWQASNFLGRLASPAELAGRLNPNTIYVVY